MTGPKPKVKSPYRLRLEAKVNRGAATPEEVTQHAAIRDATTPRYPDDTGVSGVVSKWPITDTLTRMMGGDAPTVGGLQYLQGGVAIPGEVVAGRLGTYHEPVNHISLDPRIVPGTAYYSPWAYAGEDAPEDVLVHEFGHAMQSMKATPTEDAYGRSSDPELRDYYQQRYADPGRDAYARRNSAEHFAQTFRNAMRFARAHDTTGLGQANDSIPGTEPIYRWIRRKFLP